MNNRQNVLEALRRGSPQSVPFDFVLCPSQIETFREKTGTDDYMEHFAFPFRYIEPNATDKNTDYKKYYTDLPPDAQPLNWNPEWGIYGKASGTAHFQGMLHPMQDFTGIEQFAAYPLPDFEQAYRWAGVDNRVRALKDDDLIAVANMQMTIFEISWYMRGMDNFIIDMMINPDLSEFLLERVTALREIMAANYAKSGVDILMLGDDIGSQRDMMIDPQLWRDVLKPKLRRVIEAAKRVNPDILIFYHSDGNITKVIPDLIEVGIDVLNPIQPECMDPVVLKNEYGDVLSFWGAVGTQSVLPFYTKDEVKEECKKLIEQVGRGGGLLLAPTHVIEPEVPFENIMAFLEAIEEYGRY